MSDDTNKFPRLQAAARLASQIEKLSLLNPEAHAQVRELVEKIVDNPAMSEGEIHQEFSRIAGRPIGVPKT